MRSLFIQASFNFWRMQNLGFAFAVIPLVKAVGGDRDRMIEMLNRHLQSFNTNPYMSGAVLGSVVKLEEERHHGQDIVDLKRTLMGPYAAMGDTFFWGAWRTFCVIGAATLSLEGVIWAPLIFLVIYNPLPLYIRVRGFMEGYRKGRGGIDFINRLNLANLAGKTRWMSIILLAFLGVLMLSGMAGTVAVQPDLPTGLISLVLILGCFWMINQGIAPFKVLYGMVALTLLLSL